MTLSKLSLNRILVVSIFDLKKKKVYHETNMSESSVELVGEFE